MVTTGKDGFSTDGTNNPQQLYSFENSPVRRIALINPGPHPAYFRVGDGTGGGDSDWGYLPVGSVAFPLGGVFSGIIYIDGHADGDTTVHLIAS